ncbi:MAG: hypothetical protein COA78_12080 [Blastopirellula sp.]|nr:MAG: hypothetical protein COA78_12080 [Blastopirellula sp.]
MKTLLILLTLVLTLPCQAEPPSGENVAYTLTGACAVWTLQGAASKKANNEVINKFLTIFWTDWAKSLKLTVEEAVALCDAMLIAYEEKHPFDDSSPKELPLDSSI